MRAVKLTEPKKLETVQEETRVPESGDAVIKVSACGVCGSDLHYWEMGAGMDGRPGLVMGHEFCGTLENPGPRQDLNPGDRVTYIPLNPCGDCIVCRKGMPHLCPKSLSRPIPGNNAPGAFAEKVTGRADLVRKIPDTLSDEEACLVEPSAVALHAVRQSGFRAPEKVLVIGAGPIGLLCAAWARFAGAGLVGISEINPYRIEYAENIKYAHRVFDGREEKLKKSFKQASDGGFDAVIETSATDSGIAAAMSALKSKGTLVLAGINFSPQSVSTMLFTSKELVQKGSLAYTIVEFDTALAFMADKRLETKDMVNRSLGFSDLQEAFEQLYSGSPGFVKAAVRP